jgi:aspartyl-tRNA(Asn)/glutamyl-tRNA(Gln) amidotransferase subunit A
VVTGADDRDAYALPRDGTDYRQGLEGGIKGLRIGYSPALGFAKVDREIADAVERAARSLVDLGARVELVDPGFADPRDAWLTLWFAGAAKALGGYSAEERRRMDPGLSASVSKGLDFSAVDWLGADAVRTAVSQKMAEFHRRFDLLVTPSVAVPALKVGELLSDPSTQEEWVDWAPFSYPFNLTRQPAASVPCGLTAAGLPIGLQIVGRMFDDALVLRAARAFERAHPPARCPLE